jgi:hypothetical protein
MSRVRVEAARCEALFASSLQGSQHPDPEQVREAVVRAIRSLGLRGCCAQVAQEFGDHPETAAARMRWAREAVSLAYPAFGRPRSWALASGLTPRPLPVEALPVETAPAAALDPAPAAA